MMKYEPLRTITYKECLEILDNGDETELTLLPLRAGEYLENWREAQDICIRCFESSSPEVRANAVLGLSYVARNHSRLDLRLVKPYILRELRENTETERYRERVIYSIEDINTFLDSKLGYNILCRCNIGEQ